MHRMKSIMLGLVLGLSAAGTANADDHAFYGTVRAGVAFTGLKDTKSRTPDGDVKLGDAGNTTRFLGSLGLGYHFAPGWRVEGEYVLPGKARFEHRARLAEGDVGVGVQVLRSQRLMLNLYRDIDVSDRFSLYGNVGVGAAFVKMDGKVTTQPDNERVDLAARQQTRLAWNIGAGASYALSDSLNLDLGYRYVQIGKIRTGDVSGERPADENGYLSGKLRMHEVYLGARYRY